LRRKVTKNKKLRQKLSEQWNCFWNKRSFRKDKFPGASFSLNHLEVKGGLLFFVEISQSFAKKLLIFTFLQE
jgi:hypothetical protein